MLAADSALATEAGDGGVTGDAGETLTGAGFDTGSGESCVSLPLVDAEAGVAGVTACGLEVGSGSRTASSDVSPVALPGAVTVEMGSTPAELVVSTRGIAWATPTAPVASTPMPSTEAALVAIHRRVAATATTSSRRDGAQTSRLTFDAALSMVADNDEKSVLRR